jgi:hypothetical protein
MVSTSYTSPVSQLYHSYYLKKSKQQQQQRGRGKFGQIYQGQRFPGQFLLQQQQQQQNGRGIGSFLGTVARGIANLIDRTPKWVKSGAKIVGKSTLQGLSDYAGDIQSGVPSDVARKRAIRTTLGTMLEKGGKKLQEGGRRRRAKKMQAGGACCKIKRLNRTRQTGGKKLRQSRVKVGGRKRRHPVAKKKQKKKKKAIKRRAKFDLFSV